MHVKVKKLRDTRQKDLVSLANKIESKQESIFTCQMLYSKYMKKFSCKLNRQDASDIKYYIGVISDTLNYLQKEYIC